MCTRTRRHARFRIAFVEFVQYEDTVIKQDGDNKVSNRDFSLGLNVGATIAFNYYF